MAPWPRHAGIGCLSLSGTGAILVTAMRRSLGIVLLCVVSFAAGAAVQRLYDRRAVAPDAGRAATPASPETVDTSVPVVDFARLPLWAYGVVEPPKPGDKATPQAPPTRNLRPNEDATEQTRSRQAPDSSASFSLVDIRDGGNVIDWHPEDHPPMSDIIRLGRRRKEGGRTDPAPHHPLARTHRPRCTGRRLPCRRVHRR